MPYIEALCEDIAHYLQIFSPKFKEISSIFFGGGTPSLLEARFYESVFRTISTNARLSKDCEITFEANINHLSKQWCEDIRSLGANRLSVGIQSFESKKLVFLEREHRVKDIEKHINIAYNAGFKNLSCDLIYDTPFDTPRSIESEISRATKLPINHISAYSLSIDKGSRFSDKSVIGKSMESSHSSLLRDALEYAGFHQYEVSNYEKGTMCCHNLGYWQGKEYIGCGLSAVGRVGDTRSKAHTKLDMYIKEPLWRAREVLSERDLFVERLMLGLRCYLGTEITPNMAQNEAVQMLIDEGKCEIKTNDNKSHLVARDLFLADEIALWLLRRGIAQGL